MILKQNISFHVHFNIVELKFFGQVKRENKLINFELV